MLHTQKVALDLNHFSRYTFFIIMIQVQEIAQVACLNKLLYPTVVTLL